MPSPKNPPLPRIQISFRDLIAELRRIETVPSPEVVLTARGEVVVRESGQEPAKSEIIIVPFSHLDRWLQLDQVLRQDAVVELADDLDEIWGLVEDEEVA